MWFASHLFALHLLWRVQGFKDIQVCTLTFLVFTEKQLFNKPSRVLLISVSASPPGSGLSRGGGRAGRQKLPQQTLPRASLTQLKHVSSTGAAATMGAEGALDGFHARPAFATSCLGVTTTECLQATGVDAAIRLQINRSDAAAFRVCRMSLSP